jgi:glycopeptide antibiotics resistance protein
VSAESQRLKFGRNTLLAITVLYAVVVAMLTVVPTRVTRSRTREVNVVPLGSVMECITDFPGRDVPRRCIANVLGNVLLFVPFGMAFAAIRRRHGSPALLLVTAALVSTCIEAIQYVEQTVFIGRIVDIDDVLWNTIGAYIGFAILRVWRERVVVPPR